MSPEPKPAGKFGVKADDRESGMTVLEAVNHARLDERREVDHDVVVRNPQESGGVGANPCGFDGNDADRVGVRRKKNPEPERGGGHLG